jgi:hypothetical protein
MGCHRIILSEQAPWHPPYQRPPEPVIGLAEGEARWRGVTTDVLPDGLFDLPDGQIIKSCPAPSKKIFLLASGPTRIYIPCIPLHSEGRYANVTDVGAGCGGRSGARDGRCS